MYFLKRFDAFIILQYYFTYGLTDLLLFLVHYNIYIHTEKKNATFCVLWQKNETFSHSFTFFA